MNDFAVEITGVAKKFRIYTERNQSLKSTMLRRRRSRYEDFSALRDVSFDIPTGSKFAIVGSNGSGKSTLLKCIAGILWPDAGGIVTRGRMTALLEIGSGFHPDLSGRDNVYLNAAILGFSKAQIARKFDEIVDFAGVERFIDQPVKTYSSGMFVRLAFAVAINVDPEILLLDEVLAVGDAEFQQKCVEKFAEFQDSGRTIVVVSHALPVLTSMCDTAVWLDGGEVRRYGASHEVLEEYADATRPRPRTQGDGSTRWGTGAINVDAVDVLGADGEPLEVPIRPGSAVRLRLRFTARERIQDPVFTLVITAIDGTVLWARNTVNLTSAPVVVPGPSHIDFDIDRLPVSGADFCITAAINESNSQVMLDYAKDIARLRMKAHRGDESGHLALDGVWSPSESGAR